MKYERILVIGDIHGQFKKLSSVFNKINFNAEKDYLILLGDYIDRGSENLHCLQWAMKINEMENTAVLRGNHEQMMLFYYLLGNFESTIWLPNGGDKTKAEIDEWCKKDPEFLNKALKFIYNLPLYHKIFIGDKEYIFCHAGLNPYKSFDEQDEESLLWIRENFYNNYSGSAEVVVGHTPTPYLGDIPGIEKRDIYFPVRLPNKITLLDTGSFLSKGKISCMDILSGEIWQSDVY
ncbi:MAG: metallophosphoesterase [Selenomonadaceae bacterium]|nr:metallophosphoesterase [Selenomonadaceae bacterium]